MKQEQPSGPSHVSAFTRLFDGHFDRVVRFAQRRVDNSSDASDVAAETFRRAWECCLRDNKVPAPGWLFITAHNIIGDLYRSRNRAGQLDARLREDVMVGGVDGPNDRVLETLGSLSREDQELLRLRFWDELNTTELSQFLEASVSAVWVRLHRARKRFAEQYARANQRNS